MTQKNETLIYSHHNSCIYLHSKDKHPTCGLLIATIAVPVKKNHGAIDFPIISPYEKPDLNIDISSGTSYIDNEFVDVDGTHVDCGKRSK